MHYEPLVILDGAHNPQGAQVLSEFLGELREKRIICVYGILGDKSYKEATSSIVPLCDEVIVTKPQTPRALDPLVLADEVRRYTEKVWIEENLDRALELALDRASSNDVVMCCGSLYLVGPARTFLRRKFNIPAYGGN
jgi:dihydrofolate synthase/folylpolyglutamate synthase